MNQGQLVFAQLLQTEGSLSVSEIAYRLGYTDVADSSRSFRKTVGCSPVEYRRRAAEDPR
jgi:AraC-like DNA-binding protein